MVDTPRSIADLQVLFADNSIGDLSEQDLRDFLVTTKSAKGRVSVSTPAATTISVTSTYVKAAGTTTSAAAIFHLMDTDSSNMRLRYTGSPTTNFTVFATLSLSGANNRTFGVKIFHFDDSASTGALIDESEITTRSTASTVPFAVVVETDVVMDTNDYVEIWVTDLTNTGTVTVETCTFKAQGFIT